MKKTKWWHDWNVSSRPYAGKQQSTIWRGYGKDGEDVIKRHKTSKPNGYYRIDLPHSHTEKKTTKLFTKNKHDDKRIYELVMIIDCLLYELQQSEKKKGIDKEIIERIRYYLSLPSYWYRRYFHNKWLSRQIITKGVRISEQYKTIQEALDAGEKYIIVPPVK